MRLVDRKNPSPKRLAALALLGVVITAALVLLFGGTADARPPGDEIGPAQGNVQKYEPVSCNQPWWSPTLGWDCTKIGQDIQDEVAVTIGAAASSCAAGAYFGGWHGCAAAAAGSLATAWTAWID